MSAMGRKRTFRPATPFLKELSYRSGTNEKARVLVRPTILVHSFNSQFARPTLARVRVGALQSLRFAARLGWRNRAVGAKGQAT